MSHENKQALHYLEADSMKELFDKLKTWENNNKKHFPLRSINIQKDQDKFCCIALTNPGEVVIGDC